MSRLPLKKLELSYLELGWLYGLIHPYREEMKKKVPALLLRMDILATKAYIKTSGDLAEKQVKEMKKELLKITKEQAKQEATFQPSGSYLKKLRQALGEDE